MTKPASRHLPASIHRTTVNGCDVRYLRAGSGTLVVFVRSWLSARAQYGQITLPVTLIYGDEDWSRPAERDANAREIPGAHLVTLEATGHFASLEKPKEIAGLIQAVKRRGSER